MNHLFVTQDYAPDSGGMARRHVELCRRFGDASNAMEVSTVSHGEAAAFDAAEDYPIHRQPFGFDQARRFTRQMQWARWLTRHCTGRVQVLHCGNVRPTGYAVAWTAARLTLPYLVYVNGGDLLRERAKTRHSALKRTTARRIFGRSAGIVATSGWVQRLASDLLAELGIGNPPQVAAIDLGTDPDAFGPRHDGARLRADWNIGAGPVMLTVARLVPHKGQDTGIRVLAQLAADSPGLKYVLVGEGHDEARLRALASELGVADRVVFAGSIPDSRLAEAYATSTVYLGASRVDDGVNAEGFGIAFLEASASGLPVVTGDSGGVRSAVLDGVTGMVVDPMDTVAVAGAVRALLLDPGMRARLGAAGREAVERHFNWDRVARETREFTRSVAGSVAA